MHIARWLSNALGLTETEDPQVAGATPIPNGLVAHLYRIENTKDHTLGELHIEGELFWVLERPWLDNKSNISCIPTGNYNATYLPRSTSGKYKKVYWVKEVVNRGGILVHSGNLVKHSLGCLIIGKRAGMLEGKRAVLNSRTALAEFGELAAQRTIDLEILEQ